MTDLLSQLKEWYAQRAKLNAEIEKEESRLLNERRRIEFAIWHTEHDSHEWDLDRAERQKYLLRERLQDNWSELSKLRQPRAELDTLIALAEDQAEIDEDIRPTPQGRAMDRSFPVNATQDQFFTALQSALTTLRAVGVNSMLYHAANWDSWRGRRSWVAPGYVFSIRPPHAWVLWLPVTGEPVDVFALVVNDIGSARTRVGFASYENEHAATALAVLGQLADDYPESGLTTPATPTQAGAEPPAQTDVWPRPGYEGVTWADFWRWVHRDSSLTKPNYPPLAQLTGYSAGHLENMHRDHCPICPPKT